MIRTARPWLMVAILLLGGCDNGLPSFVNWESPHIHPLALTPDGKTLLAVNTPDNRLEVFDVQGEAPVSLGSVRVGLDPVSVRARSNSEAWVVNHVSDSVSIVDLPTRRVVATLNVGDEPCDVAFAGTPQRAFITLAQENRIKVYDPADLSAAPTTLEIEGEDPRALAVDASGQRVFAAIFESGNCTTVLNHVQVSSPDGPYGGQNPPPNKGDLFDPPITTPDPPEVSQIVRKIDGRWLDDNGRDWSAYVAWDLHDHDVAIIDAASLEIGYAFGLMNLDMALAPRPDGMITVVGSEAINHVRFEPNVKGVFNQMVMAAIDPTRPATKTVADLNPHLAGVDLSQGAGLRDLSISDPRAIVWSADGQRGYVAGMGTDNVIAISPDGARLDQAQVASGPTGLALDDERGRLYVLSKFAASLTVLSAADLSEIATASLFDPTPEVIRRGRPHLYNATKSSALGQLSCASCHVDARMDQVAWDLGDPGGGLKAINQNCNVINPFACEPWHPMKGPMTSQTLMGAGTSKPLHWRGDREDLSAFNGAFVSLLGADRGLTDAELAEFDAFVATLTFPPNPFRGWDGAPHETMTIRGETAFPRRGEDLYLNARSDNDTFRCVSCHTLPTGGSPVIFSRHTLVVTQDIEVPQLRATYEKTGYSRTSPKNNRGFGITHDGVFDNVQNFLTHVVFTVPDPQDRLDLEAFVLAISTDTHPAVGAQATLTGDLAADAAARTRIEHMLDLAGAGKAGLVAARATSARTRGYAFRPEAEVFQSDRAAEEMSSQELMQAAAGAEVTFTVVPLGSERRIGIDRDLDGRLDGDELDAGTNPAAPD